MPKNVLVSACLLGQPVRFDGRCREMLHAALARWQRAGRIISFCPEVSAGLAVPRLPAEIERGRNGADVLAGRARVLDISGADVTEAFVMAAENALATARDTGCAFALLADGSPSCGSTFIYDGNFEGKRHPGAGVTSVRLRQAGIEVFGDNDIERLVQRMADPGS